MFPNVPMDVIESTLEGHSLQEAVCLLIDEQDRQMDSGSTSSEYVLPPLREYYRSWTLLFLLSGEGSKNIPYTPATCSSNSQLSLESSSCDMSLDSSFQAMPPLWLRNFVMFGYQWRKIECGRGLFSSTSVQKQTQRSYVASWLLSTWDKQGWMLVQLGEIFWRKWWPT